MVYAGGQRQATGDEGCVALAICVGDEGCVALAICVGGD
jgi:hypothetical protein